MNFEQARFNMVEQQIRPWEVLDQDVLDLLMAVRREEFVPAAYKTLAFADIDLDSARMLRLDEHPELKPLLKSNGYALPGFRSGWFRLRNWQKAFVATSDGDRVLWLPTRRGFGLLLQPREPRRLLQRLRELASSPAR